MSDSILPDVETAEGALPQVILDFVLEKQPVAVMLLAISPSASGKTTGPAKVNILLSQSIPLDALAQQLRALADMYETEWFRAVEAKEA